MKKVWVCVADAPRTCILSSLKPFIINYTSHGQTPKGTVWTNNRVITAAVSHLQPHICMHLCGSALKLYTSVCNFGFAQPLDCLVRYCTYCALAPFCLQSRVNNNRENNGKFTAELKSPHSDHRRMLYTKLKRGKQSVNPIKRDPVRSNPIQRRSIQSPKG